MKTITEIAQERGVTYAEALAEASSNESLHLLVFHSCQEEPVEVRELGTGFPQNPWTCPVCGKQVNSYDLVYEFALI